MFLFVSRCRVVSVLTLVSVGFAGVADLVGVLDGASAGAAVVAVADVLFVC